MKRILSVLLILMTVSLAGCADQQDVNLPKTLKFYYCNTDISYNEPDGLISAEIRERQGNANTMEAIVTEYLKGPSNDKYYSPFPDGTALTELNMGDDVLYITLNKNFSDLTGIDLTLACACMAKTMREIADVDTIVIDVANGIYGKNLKVTIEKDGLITADRALYADG